MNVPCLVRIKPGALQRLGLYLARSCLAPVALLHSQGLLQSILDVARQSLRDHGIAAICALSSRPFRTGSWPTAGGEFQSMIWPR